MKFDYFLNELASVYGAGITFFDIDETIFSTKAQISVMKDGKVVKKLSNQAFNTYKLKPGEEFDFGEFKNAELFRKTSEPIKPIIDRIIRMLSTAEKRGSSIVLLTARANFDDKETFLQTFRDVGIDIDKIYVERAGNMKEGTTSEKKKSIIMKYIKTGKYRRVRLVDDDIKNIQDFLSLKTEMSPKIINKVKKVHNITGPESIDPIEFYALLVKDGKITRIGEQ